MKNILMALVVVPVCLMVGAALTVWIPQFYQEKKAEIVQKILKEGCPYMWLPNQK